MQEPELTVDYAPRPQFAGKRWGGAASSAPPHKIVTPLPRLSVTWSGLGTITEVTEDRSEAGSPPSTAAAAATSGSPRSEEAAAVVV